MYLMRAAELYENVSFADFQIFHQRQFLQSEEYDNYSFKLLCLIYGFKFRYTHQTYVVQEAEVFVFIYT